MHSNAPDTVVTLGGTGTQTSLSRTPSTLSFGNRDIDDGPATTQATAFTNDGTEPVTITGIGFDDSTSYSQAVGTAPNCGVGTTLNAGDSCNVWVQFDPATVGSKPATLTVTTDVLPPIATALSGSGIQTELTPSPTTLAFGNRDITSGPTLGQQAVVTNSGTETVTISTVAVSGDSDQFVRDSSAGTDCVDGTVLTAGQTCNLRFAFDPTTKGAKAATVTVSSNADGDHGRPDRHRQADPADPLAHLALVRLEGHRRRSHRDPGVDDHERRKPRT